VVFIQSGLLLINLVNWLYNVFYFLLIVRIVFSFIRLGRDANPTLLRLIRLVYSLTEPVLAPLRRVIRPVHLGGGGYLDLSPILSILLLGVVRSMLVRIIIAVLL
jgi:YggT family protein